jgi:hypothetical protein
MPFRNWSGNVKFGIVNYVGVIWSPHRASGHLSSTLRFLPFIPGAPVYGQTGRREVQL